jgi:hypothetical protein
MLASVLLRLPDGSLTTLGPGDIVGRMATAALVLDDARVSEAHALVSFRGAELQLLALRGMFAVNGAPTSKVTLAPGQRLTFAGGVDLTVESVSLPSSLDALRGDGLSPQVLTGVASLLVGPPPRLVPGSQPDADAWLWSNGEGWRLTLRGGAAAGPAGPSRDLVPGDTFEVGGRRFELTGLRVERAGVDATEAAGRVGEGLQIVAAWDTVQLLRPGHPTVLISGVSARLVSALAEVRVALSWDALARELWPGDDDRASLRRRLDVALSRLRARLKAAGIRADLVRATGAGHVELILYPGDTVEDRS